MPLVRQRERRQSYAVGLMLLQGRGDAGSRSQAQGRSSPSASTETAVLFVLGSGRSGSTLLANLLGEAPGHSSVGEVRYLWERALGAGRPCGCGRQVADCPLWGPVLARAFPDGIDAQQVAASLRAATRLRETLRLLAPGGRRRLARQHPQLLDALERLYASLGEQTGGGVVVDASKLPTYALLLGAVPGIRLRLLHLVRDPRAAAWSWQRVKPLADARAGAMMQRQSPLKSALLWSAWNGLARLMGLWPGSAYQRLRYEDFVEEPRRTASSALAASGATDLSLPFVDDHRVLLGVSHSVAGNPNRMDSGEITLRPDLEWVDRLPARHVQLVTLLTAPLLAACGYRLRVRAAR